MIVAGKLKNKLYDRAFNSVNYILLALVGLLTVYPFYYMFINSINDPVDSSRGAVSILPRILSTAAYQAVLQANDFSGPMMISILRTVLGAVTHVACTVIVGYCVSKKSLLFRSFFMKLIVLTMYFTGGLIPTYMVMKWTGLTNNFLVYIIPNLTNAFDIILFKTFIEQLPPSLSEAAEIDGANDFKILVKVIIPLCLPIIATITLFNSVWQWNSWYDNYIYTSSVNQLTTLQYILVKMLMQSEAARQIANRASSSAVQMSPESLRMAITMIITLPILFVYPFLQKYFVGGIMIGAVKG